MTICEVCNQRQGTRSSIIGDYYYRSLCGFCHAAMTADQAPNAAAAAYNRQRDLEDHLADVIQPYNGDGKPSAEFIHLYPDKAATMFSQDDIDSATRA